MKIWNWPCGIDNQISSIGWQASITRGVLCIQLPTTLSYFNLQQYCRGRSHGNPLYLAGDGEDGEGKYWFELLELGMKLPASYCPSGQSPPDPALRILFQLWALLLDWVRLNPTHWDSTPMSLTTPILYYQALPWRLVWALERMAVNGCWSFMSSPPLHMLLYVFYHVCSSA